MIDYKNWFQTPRFVLFDNRGTIFFLNSQINEAKYKQFTVQIYTNYS